MTSPAVGIAYMIWLRLRWGAAATVIYLFALSVAAHFLPADPMVMALTLLTAAITHLLHVFTLGPADFGVKSSGYPANMFVLPLRTRTLTGWPILYGAATFAMLWVLVVALVLKPIGFSPPVLWPAAIAAASAAWVQAIGWAPFPTPFARVPVLALAAIPLILMGTWAAIYLESRSVAAIVTAGSLIWVALAHGFAVMGLARARCGAESTWSVVPDKILAAVALRLASIFNLCRQFPSASTAQLWHECRRNAVFLPAMMAFIGLPLLALNCHAVLNPSSDRTMLFGTVTVTPAAMSLMIWIFVPLMLATSLGQGMGKFDMWGKETMPSFFAIRPMSTSHYVVLKMIAVAIERDCFLGHSLALPCNMGLHRGQFAEFAGVNRSCGTGKFVVAASGNCRRRVDRTGCRNLAGDCDRNVAHLDGSEVDCERYRVRILGFTRRRGNRGQLGLSPSRSPITVSGRNAVDAGRLAAAEARRGGRGGFSAA